MRCGTLLSDGRGRGARGAPAALERRAAHQPAASGRLVGAGATVMHARGCGLGTRRQRHQHGGAAARAAAAPSPDEAQPLLEKELVAASSSWACRTTRCTRHVPRDAAPGEAALDQARPLYERARGVRGALRPHAPDTLISVNNLAVVLKAMGRLVGRGRCTSACCAATRRSSGRRTRTRWTRSTTCSARRRAIWRRRRAIPSRTRGCASRTARHQDMKLGVEPARLPCRWAARTTRAPCAAIWFGERARPRS